MPAYIMALINAEAINKYSINPIFKSEGKSRIADNKKKINPVNIEISNIFSFLTMLFAKTDFTPNFIAKIATPQKSSKFKTETKTGFINPSKSDDKNSIGRIAIRATIIMLAQIVPTIQSIPLSGFPEDTFANS